MYFRIINDVRWKAIPRVEQRVRHCGLVVSAPAWGGTGCEFDSWQCRIYIPCSLSLRLLGSFRGSLGTYGLTQKLCLKKGGQHGMWRNVWLCLILREERWGETDGHLICCSDRMWNNRLNWGWNRGLMRVNMQGQLRYLNLLPYFA